MTRALRLTRRRLSHSQASAAAAPRLGRNRHSPRQTSVIYLSKNANQKRGYHTPPPTKTDAHAHANSAAHDLFGRSTAARSSASVSRLQNRAFARAALRNPSAIGNAHPIMLPSNTATTQKPGRLQPYKGMKDMQSRNNVTSRTIKEASAPAASQYANPRSNLTLPRSTGLPRIRRIKSSQGRKNRTECSAPAAAQRQALNPIRRAISPHISAANGGPSGAERHRKDDDEHVRKRDG